MKTKTIIISLLAATLWACGGGTTQNQGQQGTDNGKAARSKSCMICKSRLRNDKRI